MATMAGRKGGAAEIGNCLNEVIQMNLDSRDGFQQAANEIKDENLKKFFQEVASERARQAEELQQQGEHRGCETVEEGSYVAAMHRAWLKVRSAIASDNRYAILAEAERGEDQIKLAYENALQSTSEETLVRLLDKHYKRVLATHDRVRDLRDACK